MTGSIFPSRAFCVRSVPNLKLASGPFSARAPFCAAAGLAAYGSAEKRIKVGALYSSRTSVSSSEKPISLSSAETSPEISAPSIFKMRKAMESSSSRMARSICSVPTMAPAPSQRANSHARSNIFLVRGVKPATLVFLSRLRTNTARYAPSLTPAAFKSLQARHSGTFKMPNRICSLPI